MVFEHLKSKKSPEGHWPILWREVIQLAWYLLKNQVTKFNQTLALGTDNFKLRIEPKLNEWKIWSKYQSQLISNISFYGKRWTTIQILFVFLVVWNNQLLRDETLSTDFLFVMVLADNLFPSVYCLISFCWSKQHIFSHVPHVILYTIRCRQ